MVLTTEQRDDDNSDDNNKNKRKTTDNEKKNDNSEDTNNTQYECNICLDVAHDAVISMCGHLFCWPCLHKWLESKSNSNQTCPVCKSAISREKVIPLYGRNSTEKKDPRDKIPPRPQGQRTEPTRNNFMGFNGFEGLQVSFGIGAFPFSFLATTFNFGNNNSTNEHRIPTPSPGSAQYAEEQFLSRIFLIIAIIFIIWILLA